MGFGVEGGERGCRGKVGGCKWAWEQERLWVKGGHVATVRFGGSGAWEH